MIRKVVFMGTPDFAVPCLQVLLKDGYEVQAVFTQPDKARGRSGKPVPCPVKAEAVLHGIPVYQPVRIRHEENEKILAELNPDVIVVTAFGQIIPSSILHLPPYGCVNVHASLLPAWRGAAPIQWAVMNGDKVSGVTTMQMNEGLDTGDILLQRELPLAPDETGGSLFDKLSAAGAGLLSETLKALSEGTVTPVRQPEESPTPYAAMLKKQTGCIDWEKGAGEIERMVRALDPWPSAYTYLNGKQLKIWKAEPLPAAAGISGEAPAASGEAPAAPGTVTMIGRDSFTVQTGSGTIRILALQLEGKKRMDTEAFLRGYRLEAGMKLG